MLATAALMLVLACPAADPSQELRDTLDSYQKSGFSGVYAVYKEGKEIFWHAVGFADPLSKRTYTRDTLFDIGSIVKPMVETTLLMLEAEGKIRRDETIGKFFEGVPKDKQAITVGMLADHRSGFQDVFGDDYQPVGRDELMRRMLASKLLYAPGAEEEYSNSGYSMLATILEKVTGQGIEQAIAQREFKPLGLEHLGYVLPKWNRADQAIGTRRIGTRFGGPLDQLWLADGPSWHLRGNGGMLATVSDLAAWAFGLHSGKLLNEELYRRWIPVWAEGTSERSLWAVAGGNGIFNTIAAYSPHTKLTIVAASTNGAFAIEEKFRELVPLARKL